MIKINKSFCFFSMWCVLANIAQNYNGTKQRHVLVMCYGKDQKITVCRGKVCRNYMLIFWWDESNFTVLKLHTHIFTCFFSMIFLVLLAKETWNVSTRTSTMSGYPHKICSLIHQRFHKYNRVSLLLGVTIYASNTHSPGTVRWDGCHCINQCIG
jgi:hypothetical protein